MGTNTTMINLDIHLHPIIVHFPIALLVSALGLEILSLIFKKENLHQAAWCNYILGALAAALAVLTALIEDETLKHTVFYIHRSLGYWTAAGSLSLLVGLWLVKRKTQAVFRRAFLIVLVIVSCLTLATGYYGGRLVYEYGIGVEE
ncbi:MAG: hypothetical protein NG712_03825 [Omnitrophica bacterium]|nr:hypothetical protein [Candidatus Omnitrophota bacterium]